MKNACEKWKEPLLEAVLTGAVTSNLQQHLRGCTNCSAELENLRARKARLDELLPLVAQGAEPSPDFRARVLQAAEAVGKGRSTQRWRGWTLVTAAAMVVILLIVGVTWRRGTGEKIPADELAAAQKLAEWRAPSDTLLATPGQEILRTTPRLGKSYLNVPVKKAEEE